MARAFILRRGLPSYDCRARSYSSATAAAPSAPPTASSAIPTPLQTAVRCVFLAGSSAIVATPTPSVSFIDCSTVPSESTIADSPGNTPLISFGGGLYDRPTLFTIATGTPSACAYQEARCVPGGVGSPPPLLMSGDACGMITKSADSFRNCDAAKQ